MESSLTKRVEAKMKEWGNYEDWIRGISLGLILRSQNPKKQEDRFSAI
jgi:hypothetical protein